MYIKMVVSVTKISLSLFLLVIFVLDKSGILDIVLSSNVNGSLMVIIAAEAGGLHRSSVNQESSSVNLPALV